MTSIRTKLIFYVNITIAIMDLISILLFFIYLKKNEQSSLEKLGISLVSLVSQDNEVKQALSYTQPALLAIPIQRMLSLDRSGEVAYWRILNAKGVLIGENAQGVNLDANEIPTEKEGGQHGTFFTPRAVTCSKGEFYHCTATIFESTPFSEEVFAAQMLDGEDVVRQKEGRILGYAQVGLSTRKMNSKILKIIFYSIIPAGLGIFLGGLCITLLLTKHIISPIQRLTGITQGIARGDLTRTVEVRSEDEIGQLSIHFNQMTESLQEAHNQLEIRIKERTADLLEMNKLLEEEIVKHKNARAVLTKYEILISQITDLPYICDIKGNIVFVNYMFDKLTGHRREEFIGKPFAPLFDEKNYEIAAEAYAKTLRGECPQFELRFKDTGILCEYKNLPLHDEAGNIIGIIGTARDVTERKRMVDALKQAKEHAENLIETANVMVIGLDLQGNVQVFNKTAEVVTGYKKDDVLGKNCFKILMPNDVWFDSKQTFAHWRANRRMQDTYESPILTKSGKKRYLLWQSSEIIDQGDVAGIISFGNDITDHKQKELLIEQLRIMAFVKDVGIAINQGDTLSEILQQCAEAIVSAAFARIWTLNEKEGVLELQASAGIYTNKNGVHSRIPVGELKVGLIARYRIPQVTNDLSNDPYVSDPDWVRREGMVAFAGYPLVAKDRLVGVLAVFARKPIIESMLNALAAAADIIAMGIDRKRAAEALSVSENKYRVLLENLPQRIFYKDRNLVYVSCSENYAKDLNIRPDEIIGKTDYDFYPKDLAEKYRADDKKVIESGQTIDVEEKYIKDEKELFVHSIKTPLRDEHGAVIGILGVFLDVSEKVSLQMEAVRVRHLVSLGELAAGVAHEINNPIMGVINCAQILFDRGSDGSREKDVANRIIKEGKRIANIVSRLLSYARRGETRESVRIHELVSEALILTEAQLHKEGILINVSVPQQLPAIFVQPQQIQQVFLNLISNARYALNQKYPGEHAGKTLDISAQQIAINNSPYVRIDFYDKGTGIPSGLLGKVMDPFFTSKPKGKGTGLGLSISHGIISGHGGKLNVESNEGEFTRIIITLPVAQEA
ncbi:MAG: PAS domain S-box protein [Planctomycetes bacterium]|nr:PAS domain S-box protein [Planctomycetota bacterium]